MHDEVVALLAADASAGDFLESSPLTLVDTALSGGAHAPVRLGQYRILREIGRGGMGVVFLAARDDGTYEKDVAIKVMRFGGGAQMLRRFSEERRILAQLAHPHIAALLDGGSTDDGQPYLVMEHVEGRPDRQLLRW